MKFLVALLAMFGLTLGVANAGHGHNVEVVKVVRQVKVVRVVNVAADYGCHADNVAIVNANRHDYNVDAVRVVRANDYGYNSNVVEVRRVVRGNDNRRGSGIVGLIGAAVRTAKNVVGAVIGGR